MIKAFGEGGRGINQALATRETWEILRETTEQQVWARGVWFSMATPKFAFIVSLAMQNRLSNMDRISKWSHGVDTICVLCKNEVETLDHLFFKCEFSGQLWRYLVRGLLGNSYSEVWSELVQKISGGAFYKRILFCLRYAFHAAIYAIWRERNKVKHGEKLMPMAVLAKLTEKGVRNKLSIIRGKGGKGMENVLQYWFQSRV